MARSYKKTPISGMTTCQSDKKDKQKANRNTRRRERVSLSVVNISAGDGVEEHLGTHRFEGNPSYFSKDGKQFHHGRSVKYSRGPRFRRTFWKDLRK